MVVLGHKTHNRIKSCLTQRLIPASLLCTERVYCSFHISLSNDFWFWFELGLTSQQHRKDIRRRRPRFKVSFDWLVQRGNRTSNPWVSSAVRFLVITFLLLHIFSRKFHICQCFICYQKLNFSWIWQKMRNIPIDPHCKNLSLWLFLHFSNVMSICNQSEQFLQWGSMGKFFVFYRIQLKFRFWPHKNVNAYHVSFSSKKNKWLKSYRQKAFDKLKWNEQFTVCPFKE